MDGRRQRVLVGDAKSCWSDVRTGVPQGVDFGATAIYPVCE